MRCFVVNDDQNHNDQRRSDCGKAYFWMFLSFLEDHHQNVGDRSLYGDELPRLTRQSREGTNTFGSALFSLEDEADATVMVVCRYMQFEVLCATERSHRLLNGIQADIMSAFRIGDEESWPLFGFGDDDFEPLVPLTALSFNWQVVRVAELPAVVT